MENTMTTKIDVFTAGCESCEPAVALVDELACPDCDVAVHDLRAAGANRAIDYGVVLPAVVVNGELLSWQLHTGAGRARLATAGVGSPMQ